MATTISDWTDDYGAGDANLPQGSDPIPDPVDGEYDVGAVLRAVDKIVILGMGCSKFGERWDCNAQDLMVEAFEEALPLLDQGQLDRATVEHRERIDALEVALEEVQALLRAATRESTKGKGSPARPPTRRSL